MLKTENQRREHPSSRLPHNHNIRGLIMAGDFLPHAALFAAPQHHFLWASIYIISFTLNKEKKSKNTGMVQSADDSSLSGKKK